MKGKLKKVVSAIVCVGCLSSISAMSAHAYVKASYEQAFNLYTYSASSAPDVTSVTKTVTLPSSGTTGTDFYCTQFSGSSYAKMVLTNVDLSSDNYAYLHAAGESDRIVFDSGWISNNGGSRVVQFRATMVNANLNNNAYISAVAW